MTYTNEWGERVSELKVLRSAAGYFIGRTFWDDGCWHIYSRNSQDYYETEAEAQRALDTNQFRWRDY